MPYEVNIVENSELLEVVNGEYFDAPRHDPEVSQW